MAWLPEGSEARAVVTFREPNRPTVAEPQRGSGRAREGGPRQAIRRPATGAERGESINYGLFGIITVSGNRGCVTSTLRVKIIFRVAETRQRDLGEKSQEPQTGEVNDENRNRAVPRLGMRVAPQDPPPSTRVLVQQLELLFPAARASFSSFFFLLFSRSSRTQRGLLG